MHLTAEETTAGEMMMIDMRKLSKSVSTMGQEGQCSRWQCKREMRTATKEQLR